VPRYSTAPTNGKGNHPVLSRDLVSRTRKRSKGLERASQTASEPIETEFSFCEK
jgi:hypothetical protein